ncbi:hypothetical protein K2173_002058 [Erythroxylum novogranatense]|uniref:Transmembrane protein 230 n=1 Tax=Erythroxylum novogranatense TaxID=1862640 RepID=A0AAV8SQ82_9ROSI|nr:hypothetical protein K2173_002058 [Erythroxylum novogranatense]
MAYVDLAFSIIDEDIMMETYYNINNGPPVKEIALVIILSSYMTYNRIGGDRGHGIFFMILGVLLFIQGSYYTRIAYYAYKGYKGFSFTNIPPM